MLSFQLTTVLSVMVRGATQLETNMISVERIDEYINVDNEVIIRNNTFWIM